MTIDLTSSQIDWLKTHMKGGVRKDNRQMRESILAVLLRPQIQKPKTNVRKPTKAPYTPKYGTHMHIVLNAFQFVESMTARQAAEACGAYGVKFDTAVSHANELNRRRLLVVDHTSRESRVAHYALSANGKKALKRLEQIKRPADIGNSTSISIINERQGL